MSHLFSLISYSCCGHRLPLATLPELLDDTRPLSPHRPLTNGKSRQLTAQTITTIITINLALSLLLTPPTIQLTNRRTSFYPSQYHILCPSLPTCPTHPLSFLQRIAVPCSLLTFGFSSWSLTTTTTINSCEGTFFGLLP